MANGSYQICVIPGDGIGPEVVDATEIVLDAVQERFGVKLSYNQALMGDTALKRVGSALPRETVRMFEESDASMKGPLGESVFEFIQTLRQKHDLYVNLRPCLSYPGICPPALRPDINVLVLRENTEGFYRAIENQIDKTDEDEIWTATGVFSRKGIKRIITYAFEYEKKRMERGAGKGHVTVVTKRNVLKNTFSLWWDIAVEVGSRFPEIRCEEVYVDAFMVHALREPSRFSMVVTENLFSDIISDLYAQIAGGIGLAAGTNFNPETKIGLFEPAHGCAPTIVGTGIANPIGQVRAAALMLDFLGSAHNDKNCTEGAEAIEKAIQHNLTQDAAARRPIEVGGKARTMEIGRRLAELIKT